jgi:predicted DCC family thiol-disulfide oxidoreductase YuxK
MANERIIFFDGICNLCNQFVDFVIRKDKTGQFKFAPLQGPTAVAKLPKELRESMRSVVLFDDGKIFTESEAALRVLSGLGQGLALFSRIGHLMPAFLKSGVYRLVATHRYKIFGQRQTCRVPSAAERERFLD